MNKGFSGDDNKKILKITRSSRLVDIKKTAVGHDLLDKVEMYFGGGRQIVENPFLANMTVTKLASKIKGLNHDFVDVICELLNKTEKAAREAWRKVNNDKMCLVANGDASCDTKERDRWWETAVFYQIYPRSFMDSNGDGIGDIRGIISKLDYLHDLGIDCLWLCPVYDSPNDDNGYDVRDYEAIMQEFGTMDDFDELLTEVHRRGMRLIMDLVFNHTSDEHEWFKKALTNPDGKYGQYYFLREGRIDEEGTKLPPNNWQSCFGGSAWNYYKDIDRYGLHVFSKKQMDLNWECEDMRKDVYGIINRWLKKGVDGFRIDVVNLISKDGKLPDGNAFLGQFIGYCGAEHYFYGPRLHEHLHDVHMNCFKPNDAFSVGETPGLGLETSRLLVDPKREELDMVFNFDHMESGGHLRFDEYAYNMNWYKKYMYKWVERYANDLSFALFFENHDNPRMTSKIDPENRYGDRIAKLLATLLLTQKGTPFIFQGQELGARNIAFESIDELEDVESHGLYRQLLEKAGDTPKNRTRAWRKVLSGSRDHARTPMCWDDTPNGGFTTGKPWFEGKDEYKKYNVEAQIADDRSVLSFYKALIGFRREHPEWLREKMEFIRRKARFIYMFRRGNILVECNFSAYSLVRPGLSKKEFGDVKLMFSNVDQYQSNVLQPYEANIYMLDGGGKDGKK